jgi:tRNA-guanine transglycosylase
MRDRSLCPVKDILSLGGLILLGNSLGQPLPQSSSHVPLTYVTGRIPADLDECKCGYVELSPASPVPDGHFLCVTKYRPEHNLLMQQKTSQHPTLSTSKHKAIFPYLWTWSMETELKAGPAEDASKASLKRSRSDCNTDDGNVKIDSDIPPELALFDFSQRVKWKQSYTEIAMIAENTPPVFTEQSPALCHYVNAMSHGARACTIHLQSQPGQKQARPLPTPMFMPVGTKGCLKGVSFEELTNDPALACPIILANTYHLAIQPGTELVNEMGGLHSFQGLDKVTTNTPYNLLTDSGGFQMVSLVKLSRVTEDGVSFANPFNNNDSMLLLRPEDSIRHQNNIGANIIMALDDVVSSVAEDQQRFVTATHRTLRWYDRCYKAHAKSATQNLFPIVQGALDYELGGLREQCLAGFQYRQETLNYNVPGYAIGGLAGGEDKDQFWRVVDQCCKALPTDKPRYLMGVGYPLDIVVCVALGVDMFDCVYPTRTARFGVCLVPGPAPGTIKLKSHECSSDNSVIQQGCGCQACRKGIKRSRLHALFKTGNPVAVELITQHNIAYMMGLVRSMRQAIVNGKFDEFARSFLNDQYRGKAHGGEDVPTWVLDAMASAGVDTSSITGDRC